MSSELYTPTPGDLRYQDAAIDRDANPFEEAALLRDVSHEYLSVLLSSNSGPTSAGYRAQLEAELARRGSTMVLRANRIAAAALAVSVVAAIAAVIGLVHH